MKQINKLLPVFHINSEKEILNSLTIENLHEKYCGNGFFISKFGHFATVKHILKDNSSNYFGFYNCNLYKIKIIKYEHSDSFFYHNDAAIAKIDIKESINFFDTNCFDYVLKDSILKIIGYSNINKKSLSNTNELLRMFENKNCENIETKCTNPDEYILDKNFSPKSLLNYFTIKHIPNKYSCGLSGSPILNKNNNVVGLFKGGPNPELIGTEMEYQATKISIITEMLKEIDLK